MSQNKLNFPKSEVGCQFCNGIRNFIHSTMANLDYRELISILKMVKGSKFFRPFENTVWFRSADFLLELFDIWKHHQLETKEIKQNGRNVLEISNRTKGVKHYIMDTEGNINKLKTKIEQRDAIING